MSEYLCKNWENITEIFGEVEPLGIHNESDSNQKRKQLLEAELHA
jgi:hypothetical protein